MSSSLTTPRCLDRGDVRATVDGSWQFTRLNGSSRTDRWGSRSVRPSRPAGIPDPSASSSRGPSSAEHTSVPLQRSASPTHLPLHADGTDRPFVGVVMPRDPRVSHELEEMGHPLQQVPRDPPHILV